MFNFLFPMLVIKALEPDRDTQDLVFGSVLGATVAGGNVAGGILGRELLNRMRPASAAPSIPVLPPPPPKPETVVHEVPAADRALAIIRIAAQGASQAYERDPTPASMLAGAVHAIAGKGEPDSEQKPPVRKTVKGSQSAAA